MEPDSQPSKKFTFRGTAGAVVAAAVALIALFASSASRWFLLISGAIGVVVAIILILWHKLRPIKEQDIHNKRPLGLS